MELVRDPRVEPVFENYPEEVKQQMLCLRKLILNTAYNTTGIEQLEETLKWGEPSYVTKNGSTVRIDWKQKSPKQYAVYFKCTSKLVPTFKEIYKDKFNFENNRAIVFKIDEELPESELAHCVSLALTYHKVKHLPLLGV